MKKILISVIFLLAIIAAVVFWMQTNPDKKDILTPTNLPIKAARYYWPGAYWREIADKKGWFKEAGLNVELIDTNADYYKSLADTAAGKIDTNDFYLFSLIQYNIKGAGLVAVINSDISFGVDGIVTRRGINTFDELKGKKIGVTQDSNHEYILSLVLKQNRLALSDVNMVDMPCEKTAEEFISGRVDAIVAWEPLLSKSVTEGNGKKIFDTSEMPGICPVLTVFSSKFIKERPQDVQAFINVWHRTEQFIRENPQEAFQIIADIYKSPKSEVAALAQIDKTLDLHENFIAFSFGTGFESLFGTFYKINEFMISDGLTDKQMDPLDVIDGQFIRKIQGEEKRRNKK